MDAMKYWFQKISRVTTADIIFMHQLTTVISNNLKNYNLWFNPYLDTLLYCFRNLAGLVGCLQKTFKETDKARV